MPSSTKPALSARLASLLAILAAAAALLGPAAAFLGLLPPLAGFGLFALGLLGGGVLVLPCGVVALMRTRPRTGRQGRGRALVATLIGAGLLLLLVVLGGSSGGVPAIHDVTTDPDDPPAFRGALTHPDNRERDLTYPHGGARVPELQRKAYPDLAPLSLALPAGEVLDLARRVAEELGWGDVTTDARAGTLEATDTSRIFRFVDDVVVRVREEGEGSRVDVRSTSRVGQSDLGANAERVRAFLAGLGELASG